MQTKKKKKTRQVLGNQQHVQVEFLGKMKKKNKAHTQLDKIYMAKSRVSLGSGPIIGLHFTD